jgi:uncharacterized membrane protein
MELMKKLFDNRYLLPGIAGAIVLVVGAVMVWSAFFKSVSLPETSKNSPELTVKYVASESFGKLPDDKKKEILKELKPRTLMRASRNLSTEERNQLRQNVRPVMREQMEKHMKESMDKYFSLSKEEQVAYLDQIIDRIQAHRPPMRPESSGDGDKKKDDNRRHRPSAAAMKKHIESRTPEERAQHSEFRKAMRTRMKERGVSFKRPPR